MTILSQQLLKLRREATSSLDVDKRKRASILFEPGEAMKMTPEIVLEIARTGCNSLKETIYLAVRVYNNPKLAFCHFYPHFYL